MNRFVKLLSLIILFAANFQVSAGSYAGHLATWKLFYFGGVTGDDTLTVGWRESLDDPMSPILYNIVAKPGDYINRARKLEEKAFLEKLNDGHDNFVTVSFRGKVIHVRESELLSPWGKPKPTPEIVEFTIRKSAIFHDHALFAIAGFSMPDAGATLPLLGTATVALLWAGRRRKACMNK